MDMSDWARIKQAVLDRPGDERRLHQCFEAAVAAHQIEDAQETFNQLQRQYPGDHCIRRLRIGLYLHQEDYNAAMAIIETLTAFSTPDDALMASALAVRRRLGARYIHDKDASGGPTLSVCMIVKNEETYLGPCLNSMKNLADEIVIVDTGSTDRSADLAAVFGAHVYPFQWCNDFSTARNYALEQAKGEWILVLDADEIIDFKDQSLIRELMIEHRHDPRAFCFQTRNYSNMANGMHWQVNDGSYPAHETGLGWFPSAKVRLFPRSKSIRFHYPVHELVEPALKQAGIGIFPCDVPIHHYGNLNDARIKRKAKQYFELGYAKLNQLGHDEAALRELAIQAGQIEQWSESMELWQRYLSLCPGDGEALANLAGACWQMGFYDQGIDFAQEAIVSAPKMKEGHYNLAANQLMNGQAQAAANKLQELMGSHPDYLAAQFLLAAAFALIGKKDRADSLFEQLIERLSPDGLMAALKELVDKLGADGRTDDAATLAQTAQCLN